MDISFKQPHGYWLDRASVFVTLSEDTSSYALVGPSRGKRTYRKSALLASDYAVQITDHYGPRFLTGAETLRSETKANHFVPTIGAMGVEIGGMGHQSFTSKQRVGRWVFKGTVGKPKGRDGFRTLEWELSENDLDPDQAHNQEYHTAFAFEHSQRPVFMRIEVEGKIRSKTRQLKHNLLQFSSQFSKTDNSTLTYIDFNENDVFKKRLDHVAKGLDLAMQMENCANPPLEVPGPTPAKFTQGNRPETIAGGTAQLRPATSTNFTGEHTAGRLADVEVTRPRHTSQSIGPSHATSVTDHRGPILEQGQPRGTWRLSEVQQQEQDESSEPESEPQDDTDTALLRSLERRLQSRTGSGLHAHIRMEELKQPGKPSGSDSKPADDSDMNATTAVNSDASTHVHVPDSVEEDIRELIVRIPVILFLLRYIATMLKWLSRPQSLPAAKKAWNPSPPGRLRDKDMHESGRLLEESSLRRVDRVWEGDASSAFEPARALTGEQFATRRWGNSQRRADPAQNKPPGRMP
ncbi:hypothetical protein NKR19_g7700 [Coniochaeta hoffmannii]|uniref:Uncharacterized protein n=1 Tax=Coniochaeta hoffmannii TaxID=91930 RepID=A0AA38R6K2_9PEZI|nr:hypothetical protein NKR19_g7700 [Coniochaeta hoffmannii]